MAATETHVYWHTRRRLWSLREGGRVVAHVPRVVLRDVRFIVSEAAVRRVQAWCVREVCAYARGVLHEGPVDRWLRPVTFDPYVEAHFTNEWDDVVLSSDVAIFKEDGTCFAAP